MAKAVKDHRSKKNPTSAEAHKRRKRTANSSNAMKTREQRWWRQAQVKAKLENAVGTKESRLKKLLADAERLGITAEAK